MIHAGRHRIKSHGGIPHGSTCNLGESLEFYLQNALSQLPERWDDQSGKDNHAAQSTAGNRPTAVTGGGLDFEDTNNASTASMMDLTSFTVAVNTDFLMFIVWNPETTSTNCYLSDGTSEVFQTINASRQMFKTPTAGTNDMNHSATFTIDAGEKSVFMIHRTNGSTGTIKLYKNGLVHDPSVTDADAFDLQNLGSKNDVSHWFDGIIYDVGVMQSNATNKNRDMITDYLCSKHGIERLGND